MANLPNIEQEIDQMAENLEKAGKLEVPNPIESETKKSFAGNYATGEESVKEVLEIVRKMGKEGLKKALPHLNDEQKAVLREALSKAKAMDFDDKDHEDGEEFIELASQKGKAKDKNRHAKEDEKFVKPKAADIQHQGDSSPEGKEGQVIKAEILEKDWDSMVAHLQSKEGGGHSKESAEKIAGYINEKYVHHFAHKAESEEERAEQDIKEDRKEAKPKAKKPKAIELAEKLKAAGHKKADAVEKCIEKGQPEMAKALELVWDLAKSDDLDEAKAKHEDELEEKKKDRKAKQIEDNQVADSAVAEAEPKELVAEEREEKKIEKAMGVKGEGSRGGKIIGHTKSGKPIYEGESHKIPSIHGQEDPIHPTHEHMKNMSDYDHKRAQEAHEFLHHEGAEEHKEEHKKLYNLHGLYMGNGKKDKGFMKEAQKRHKKLYDENTNLNPNPKKQKHDPIVNGVTARGEPIYADRKLSNGYTAKIEHEKRAHVYAPNGEKVDTVHSADVERVAKEHSEKTKKSIPWSEGTQSLLKASTRRGQNAHYSVEEEILKSEAQTQEIIKKGGYLNDSQNETLKKSDDKTSQKPSINDLIEKGMDYTPTQIERIQRLAKARSNGSFTVQSFSDEDFQKAIGAPSPLPVSEEEGRKEAQEIEQRPEPIGATSSGKEVHAKSYQDHEGFDEDDHADAAKLHQAKAEELHRKSREAKMEHEKAELEKSRDAHDLHAAYHDACAVKNKTRAKAYSKELDKCFAQM